MSSDQVGPTKDGCLIPLDGCKVVQCRVDHAFTLVIDGARGAFEVRIEQPFELMRQSDGGRPVLLRLDGDPTALAPALAMLHADAIAAVADDGGRLELRFADGSVLRVPASDDFEAWTLVGPEDLRVVSTPGGGIAVWPPRYPNAADVP